MKKVKLTISAIFLSLMAMNLLTLTEVSAANTETITKKVTDVSTDTATTNKDSQKTTDSTQPTPNTIPDGQTNILDATDGITVGSKIAPLYDIKGNLLANRSLGAGSSWKTDIQNVVNGEPYFRVSTDEYVATEMVYPYKVDIANIKIISLKSVPLYDHKGKESSRSLAPGSVWYTDHAIKRDKVWYARVSTDEFVAVSDFTYE